METSSVKFPVRVVVKLASVAFLTSMQIFFR